MRRGVRRDDRLITPLEYHFTGEYRDRILLQRIASESLAMPAYKSETIYPGVRREGWLRFTVPAWAQPEDLLLVFRPLFRDEAVWRLTP